MDKVTVDGVDVQYYVNPQELYAFTLININTEYQAWLNNLMQSTDPIYLLVRALKTI